MFSKKIVNNLSRSSWIRAMFEEGEKLRKIHGAENVYDFSIGNPEVEPPLAVVTKLQQLVSSTIPGKHRYMANAGYMDVREKVAAYLKNTTGTPLSFENIIMTCGAAGGLNVVLKSILNPDEEVIILAPYFVEYLTYIDNHGGKPVLVQADTSTFQPNVKQLEAAITEKTKAIIINTPNNPSGVVYSEEILKQISKLLEQKEKEYNTTIFVLSDEPYAKITYDAVEVPSMLKLFKNSIIVNSFSKSLALPGERIGYIAANPSIKDVNLLISAMVYCNRVLGYVNAPALMQKVIADTIGEGVNVEEYKKKRDLLYNHLINLGFSCIKPEGAFYLFPKALIDDDIEFTKRAIKYNLLLVPGTGFGCPGFFRISYAVSLKTVENSLPAFTELAKEFK
jgi:aspartate aminotransferase